MLILYTYIIYLYYILILYVYIIYLYYILMLYTYIIYLYYILILANENNSDTVIVKINRKTSDIWSNKCIFNDFSAIFHHIEWNLFYWLEPIVRSMRTFLTGYCKMLLIGDFKPFFCLLYEQNVLFLFCYLKLISGAVLTCVLKSKHCYVYYICISKWVLRIDKN